MNESVVKLPFCHSRLDPRVKPEDKFLDPEFVLNTRNWIPAFAGMTENHKI